MSQLGSKYIFSKTCAKSNNEADKGDKEDKKGEDLNENDKSCFHRNSVLEKDPTHLGSCEQCDQLGLQLGLHHCQATMGVHNLVSRGSKEFFLSLDATHQAWGSSRQGTSTASLRLPG